MATNGDSTTGRTAAERPPPGGGSALARWLPPLGLSVTVVALAPFVGVLRAWVRETAGLGYLRWVAAALALAGGVALVAALLRIRERRAVRYGLLGMAAGLVALQVFGWGTGEAEVDTVERVHLLEYGLLGALFERAFRRRHRDLLLPILVLSAVTLVGIADEWVQWLTPVRTGDGRDVLLNLWAGLIGYLFAVALSRQGGRLRRPGAESRRLAAGLGAALAVAAGSFVDAAHLGHEVHDPHAGVFLSWHTPEELVAAAADRRARWGAGERPPIRPLALEDSFYSEAGWHAQVRNKAVERGDFLPAWRENRILERWYEPYLGLGGTRWPRPQRDHIEGVMRERFRSRPELVESSPRYRSPALVGRVLPAPPRSLLWAGVVATAAALAALARRGRPPAPEAPRGVRSPRP